MEAPESKCPNCAKTLDTHAETKEFIEDLPLQITPHPGDISVCGYCGTILKYGSDLKLSKADPLDLDAIKLSDPKFYDEIMEGRALIMRALTQMKK